MSSCSRYAATSSSHVYCYLYSSQCALPVFEGMLLLKDDLPSASRIEKMFLDLWWDLGLWHAIGKSRLMPETVVNLFIAVLTELGSSLRSFGNKVCPNFETVDLPKEVQAKAKRQAKAAQKKGQTSTSAGNTSSKTRAQRRFNLWTYKIHALGDYPWGIRRYGTTDNYNTQLVRFSSI